MERVVRERLKKPLSEAILFGDLEHGGRVIVDADGDQFTFQFEPKEKETTSDEESTGELSESEPVGS